MCSPVYVYVQRMKFGPVLAPGRTSPCRAGGYKLGSVYQMSDTIPLLLRRRPSQYRSGYCCLLSTPVLPGVRAATTQLWPCRIAFSESHHLRIRNDQVANLLR